MVLFPRKGDRLRAHSVFFQATRVAGSGKGVVSGMTPSRASSSSVAIASGSWSDGSGLTSYAGGSISSIPAASSGMQRYDLIVLDTSTGLVSRIAGSENTPTVSTDFLENIQPLPPELASANQILIAIVIVTSSGIPSGNFGHYATAGVADLIILVPNPNQNIKHALATAVNDFLVASGSGAYIKKTLAEVKTILGLGSAAYTSSTDYAVAAKGVTNGDSHDHSGGDGAQIAYSSLSGTPPRSGTIPLILVTVAL